MSINKKNIAPLLIAEYTKQNPMATHVEIYTKLKMTRQNFYEHLAPDRVIGVHKLPFWRLALNIKKEIFWKIVAKFYDKLPDCN